METFKLEVLKTLYTQQQSTAHILRERMSKISTGAISVLVVIDGWIISNKADLIGQLSILNWAIIMIVSISTYGVQSRYKEFCAVAKLIVRIEMAMKLYDKDEYIEGESLYPAEYKALGTKGYEHGKNISVSQSYTLIVFGILSILLASILLHG
ncbi:hypothetical protein [Candidatus Colwellia aromaticivorans]|uniref:hypothetical protein n=1 Tax=Candidatus Colwellia aromaticivorans TaxID=2267621 RepID=UPI000DF42AEB|nr:hypothetical protein [Candidatus Colwellia aromaticivorans]